MKHDVAVLVVAKAPVAGLAKTRLTPPLSPEQAADVAAAALLDTLAAVAQCPVARRMVALTGSFESAARKYAIFSALSGFEIIAQRGGTFAERLVNAHNDAASAGFPVLQIGMDTPQVDARLLERCAASLCGEDADAVLGPARDGGWWALGVKDPASAAVLAGVPMSTSTTGADTRRALQERGDRVVLLPELTDVDCPRDAIDVAAEPKCGELFRRTVGGLEQLMSAGHVR